MKVPGKRTRVCPESFVCLMYHNVPGNQTIFKDLSPSVTSYFVDAAHFAMQLEEIASLGGRCLTALQLNAFYESRDHESEAHGQNGYPVLLTFDDGWRDSVEVAGPILERQGGQAFLFVTTDFVGRPHFLSRHHLQHLPKDQFLLGSHGRTHRLLSLLTDKEIRAELQESKAFLQDLVGYPIDSLSIPGGAVDGRVRRIASEAGYRFLFTSEIHRNSRPRGPMDIGRVAIKQNTSLAAYRGCVRQRLTREWLRRTLLSGPKRLLGLAHYHQLRQLLLKVTPLQ